MAPTRYCLESAHILCLNDRAGILVLHLLQACQLLLLLSRVLLHLMRTCPFSEFVIPAKRFVQVVECICIRIYPLLMSHASGSNCRCRGSIMSNVMCAGESPKPSRKGCEARPRCYAMTICTCLFCACALFSTWVFKLFWQSIMHHLHIVPDWFISLTAALLHAPVSVSYSVCLLHCCERNNSNSTEVAHDPGHIRLSQVSMMLF